MTEAQQRREQSLLAWMHWLNAMEAVYWHQDYIRRYYALCDAFRRSRGVTGPEGTYN